jgi:hypothetical protein
MTLCERRSNLDWLAFTACSKRHALIILCTVVSVVVRIVTGDSCEAHLALPNLKFSLQTRRYLTCKQKAGGGGGGLLLNDANHEAVANNGFLVSVEPGSIKYMVFVKNCYHTVCPVVRARVG